MSWGCSCESEEVPVLIASMLDENGQGNLKPWFRFRVKARTTWNPGWSSGLGFICRLESGDSGLTKGIHFRDLESNVPGLAT